MRRSNVLLSLLALLMAVATCHAAVYHLVGKWLPATKNEDTEDLLAQALQRHTKSSLCFTEVTAIEQQIVNGIHFRYHARGCEANAGGRCSGKCPAEKKFDVELFTQPWADLVQVISATDVK